jgi:DNA-binding transcriptional LysR family regulator
MLHCVVPHLAEFRQRYPDIRLELNSNEQLSEVLEQRTDIAIRVGLPEDPAQHAQVLASSPLQVLASPEYLLEHGTPQAPEDLAGHTLIGEGQHGAEQLWPLRHGGGNSLPIVTALAASSDETRRQLALRGRASSAWPTI